MPTAGIASLGVLAGLGGTLPATGRGD
jgi:hypothetical protein